jgi:hypothetical protein
MASINNVSRGLTNEQILALSNVLINEIPIGAIDDVNKVFTVLNSYQLGSTILARNGVTQREGIDYIESADKEITFIFPPQTGDLLFVQYKLLPG